MSDLSRLLVRLLAASLWLLLAAAPGWTQTATSAAPDLRARLGQPAAGQILTPSQTAGHDVQDLRARILRLEEVNATLLNQVQEQKGIGSRQTPSGGLSADEVNRRIQEALQKHDEERKKSDEKKKKESDEKKKKDGEKKKKDDEKKKKDDETKKKTDAEKWVEVGSDMTPKLKWKTSPLFETPDKAFSFYLNGRIDWDTGWFNQSGGLPNYQDASTPRRARISFNSRIWENVFFRMSYDFSSSSNGQPMSNFKDAYIVISKLPYIENIQAGYFKEPINFDWINTANQLTFLERALAVNAGLVPPRNLGIATYRTFLDDRIYAATGLFRPANNSAFSQGDQLYAWTSRLTGLPYWAADGRYLIHLGGSYSRRSYSADHNARFETRDQTRLGTPLFLDTGEIPGSADENLFNTEFVSVWGPLTIQSEWTLAQLQALNKQKQVGYPTYWGVYFQAAYFLTGENSQYRKDQAVFVPITPFENFFCMPGTHGCTGLGAWEVAARYDYLDLRGGGYVNPTTATGAGGTGLMNSVTLGLNWYLNPQTVILLNYIHGWRNSDTIGRDGELNTFAVRFRWFF